MIQKKNDIILSFWRHDSFNPFVLCILKSRDNLAKIVELNKFISHSSSCLLMRLLQNVENSTSKLKIIQRMWLFCVAWPGRHRRMERRIYSEDGVVFVTNGDDRLSWVVKIHWILKWKHYTKSNWNCVINISVLKLICSLEHNLT